NLLRPSRDAGTLYVQRLLAGERQPVLEHDPPRLKRGRRVKDGPLTRATVSLRVAAGRALYDALAWAGACDVDPFRDVRLGRRREDPSRTGSSRVYNENEMIELLSSTRDQQERVILLLGSHGGLRVSEMLRLEWADVDLVNGELTVRGGKGGTTASVMLTPGLAEALATFKRQSTAESHLGIPTMVLALRSQYGVYNRVRNLCNRAEVPFKGIHALRHTAGT